jgi:hypothetical protein
MRRPNPKEAAVRSEPGSDSLVQVHVVPNECYNLIRQARNHGGECSLASHSGRRLAGIKSLRSGIGG